MAQLSLTHARNLLTLLEDPNNSKSKDESTKKSVFISSFCMTFSAWQRFLVDYCSSFFEHVRINHPSEMLLLALHIGISKQTLQGEREVKLITSSSPGTVASIGLDFKKLEYLISECLQHKALTSPDASNLSPILKFFSIDLKTIWNAVEVDELQKYIQMNHAIVHGKPVNVSREDVIGFMKLAFTLSDKLPKPQ